MPLIKCLLRPLDAIAANGGTFGAGVGPIFLSNVQCVGEEQNLLDCDSSGISFQTQCEHTSDVGVICTGLPQEHMLVQLPHLY